MDYGEEMLRQMSAALGHDMSAEIPDDVRRQLGESLKAMAESRGGHLHLGDTCMLVPPCRESRKAALRVVSDDPATWRGGESPAP